MDKKPALQEWHDGGRTNALELARMLDVPVEAYGRDLAALIPALQNYVERLPYDEFEQSDWITLHVDLTSHFADVLIRRHGAAWQIADDSAGPLGYRYVIEATGLDGAVHRIDPSDVVANEFRELPITIC